MTNELWLAYTLMLFSHAVLMFLDVGGDVLFFKEYILNFTWPLFAREGDQGKRKRKCQAKAVIHRMREWL